MTTDITHNEYSNMFDNANIFCNKNVNQKMLTVDNFDNIEFEKQVIFKSTPNELIQLVKNEPYKYISIIENYKDIQQNTVDKGLIVNRNQINNNLEICIKFQTDSEYTKIGYNYDKPVSDSQIVDDLLIAIKSKYKMSESILTNKSIISKHQRDKLQKSNNLDKNILNEINCKLDIIIAQNQQLFDVFSKLNLSN